MSQKAAVCVIFEVLKQKTANLCMLCVYLYLWISKYHGAASSSVIQRRQRLQDIKGDKSYLVKAIPTLPPPLRRLDDLKKDQWSFVIHSRNTSTLAGGSPLPSNSIYGCVPLMFLLVAQRAHCCFWPQSRNCSRKVSHPLVEAHFLLWNVI